MQARDSTGSDDAGAETANGGATSTEKEKLLREIKELKRIIKQCEWNLETPRFKDVEEHATTEIEESQNSTFVPCRNKIPNVQVDLQSDLYKLAGLHCAQFRKQELIFNFTSVKEQQKGNTCALQIFLKDGKASLGKWAMPMSIDINEILAKTPIDDMKNLSSFIKNCKHNVDCYVVRQEQFASLKEHLSHARHYVLQHNTGYTQINLELYGVHDTQDDKYINLIIYLMYHSNEARPYKIEVDTTDKKRLSDNLRQKLKSILKEFKMSDLQTAFDKVLLKEDSAFTWLRMDDSDDSPLQTNDTSNSEEESFLTQVRSTRRNLLRNTKRKRELQKKWSKRKKQKIPDRNIASDEEEDEEEDEEKDEEDSHSKPKASRTESPQRISAKKNKTQKVASTLRQRKNIDKSLSKETTTPLLKSKTRLKQTKLDFQIHQILNLDSPDKTPLFQTKLPNTKKSKKAKLITSTPLYTKRLSRMPSLSNLDIGNITHIEPRQIAHKLNSSGNTRKLKDPKNANKMNDSKNAKSKLNSRNDKKLKSSKSTTKLKDSKSTTNPPKKKEIPETKTHGSLKSKSRATVKRSTLQSTSKVNQGSMNNEVQQKVKKRNKRGA